MEPSSLPSPTEDALRRHGAFVRALARSLVRDASLAEDVAQDAWTRWLARPPRAGSERGWLRRVVRNLATNRLRARARRAEHEELAARPEALASGAEEAQHAELLARLVAAVLALEPAQRDTLVALYFRGLDAPALAAESGAPLATVRDRRRRALETLRARLDRDFGGRAAWAAALVRFAGPEGGALVPAGAEGASGAALKLGLVAGAAAAVAGVALWRARVPAPGPHGDALALAAAPEPRAAPKEFGRELGQELWRPAQAPRPGRRAGAAGARVRGPSEPQAPAGAQPLGASAHAEVRGRLVFADGTPAAGAELVVSLDDGASRYGIQPASTAPAGWQDVAAESATDGAFALSFEAPPGFGIQLVARAPGCAEASWSWSELAGGARVELGEIELLAAATLEGRVVDPAGIPLVGHEWRVGVRSIGLQTQSGREEVWIQVPCDPATAAFRIEGAMPGPNSIQASCPLAGRTPAAPLALAPGVLTAADVVYGGPDLERRIVLTLRLPRHAQSRKPSTAHMRLSDGGPPLTPVALEGTGSSYAFDDLAPGVYTLEIDDPEFTPWHEVGLAPGSVVRAELGGRGSVVLEVRDGETLEPVELYSVGMTLRNTGSVPSRFTPHAGAAPLAGGRVAGLFAGDYTFDLVAGERVGSVDVEDLGPGETRAVRVPLARPCALAGRVRDAAGTPQAGLELLLLRPAELEDSDASPVARANWIASPPERFRHEAGATLTDEAGAFELAGPRPGVYLLAAMSRADVTSLTQVFELAPGERRAGLELTLAAPGSLALTVLAPEGHSSAGMRVLFATEGSSDLVKLALPRELEASDRVELDGLRPGTYHAFLVLPETIQHTGNGWTGGLSVAWRDAQIVNGLALGSFVIESNALLERTFAPTHGEWPGSLELLVRVDGVPAPRVHVNLRGEDPLALLELETDAEGRLRAPCFAGAWSATIRDPRTGESLVAPEALVVLPSRPTVRTLDLARP